VSIADLMEQMAAKGASMEVILMAVRAIEAEQHASKEHRAKAAERKRRQRERERDCHVTITGQSQDSPKDPSFEVAPPAPPLPKSNQDISPYNPPSGAETDSPPMLLEPVKPAEPEFLPEHVVDEWNKVADRCGLVKVRKVDGSRLRKLRSRIREHPPNDWIEVFDAIERTPWMHGDNDRGWRIPFDFLLEPLKFQRLLEGTYERSNAIQR